MFGLFPPNSRVTRFRLDFAAASIIRCPTSVEPVNATLSTSMWRAMAAPAVGPNPGNTLMTPLGEPCLKNQLADAQRGARRLFGRLHQHGIARCQRRSELPGHHQHGEIPRDDLADDTH